MTSTLRRPPEIAKHNGELWKVLKIAPTPFFSDYGCHVRIYEETQALQRRGHKVAVVTYPSGGDVAGVRIKRGAGPRSDRAIRVGSSKGKPLLDVLLLMKSLQVGLRTRPNIVHGHLHEGALIGAFVSKILRVPLVFDFQGSLTSEMIDHRFLRPDSHWYGLFRRLETVIDHFPDEIITSSHNASELLMREFGVPASKVSTVADAVDPTLFRPAWELERDDSCRNLRHELKLPAGIPIVVYLGLLSEYQGTSRLLEAAAILKERGVPAHFLIMGFPGVDTYQRIASDIGVDDRTTFTGRIPYLQAPRYLALGDIAVSPKISETEGNGKLLNYQAVGLPTVTFNTPVAREILGSDGVFAELGSAVSLADRLQELLQDPDRCRELGRRLRAKVVADQSWDSTIERILDVYRRASGVRVG